MSRLDIVLSRPLSIEIPPIVRYMGKQYVEEFFRTGKIKLTTFAKCKKHEDETRKDENEGNSRFQLEYKSSEMGGIFNVGFQSYMLCASLVESERLKNKFNADAYFMIIDVVNFFNAISKQLIGFEYGRLGPCIYRDKRFIDRKSNHSFRPDEALLKAISGNDPQKIDEEFHKSRQRLSEKVHDDLADESYFLKEAKFSNEVEFRLIWTVSKEVNDPIIVECPEAIQFCIPGIEIPEMYKAPEYLLGDQRGFFGFGSTSNPVSE